MGVFFNPKNYIADFAGVFLEIFRFPKVGGGCSQKSHCKKSVFLISNVHRLSHLCMLFQ